MSTQGSSSKVLPLPRVAAAGGVNTPSGRFRRFNRILERQLSDAAGQGELDLEQLLVQVSEYYDKTDDERRGIVRSMQLMSDEAQELTRELREQTDGQLQAILDNVKDVILTVDAAGHIETFNPTGERVFGYAMAEVLGRRIDFLLPALAGDELLVTAQLERLASTLDDTQVDLAAHETSGRRKDGSVFDLELAVSEARVQRRTVYILCLRDTSDRKQAAAIEAAERQVLERLAANASLESALEAIIEVAEQARPQALFAIRYFDATQGVLRHGVAPKLPRAYLTAMENVPAEVRFGSCASAIALQRQVVVPDIKQDALWAYRAEAAAAAGLVSAWSTPIFGLGGEPLGTFAVYGREPSMPGPRDHQMMGRLAKLAGIAIERRRQETALRESEARFRRLFDNVVEGVYQSTLDGRLLAANPALVRMLGFDALEELQTFRTTELYLEPTTREELVRRLLADGEVRDFEFQLQRRDGSTVTVRENARLMRDVDGRVCGFEGTLNDVTARRAAEQAVIEEKERAQVTLQSIGDAVISTDAYGVVDYLNPIAELVTGWSADEARGRALDAVFPLVHEATGEPLGSPLRQPLQEGTGWSSHDQVALRNREGHYVALQSSATPIRDRNGRVVGTVVVFRDVSRERRLRRALSYQASHDALTGLINRREFEQRLAGLLEDARADATRQHALVYVDLDQFKVVNDTCGHPAGDKLLKQVTGLLQTRVRARDVLARLGGDEFGLLLEDCSLDQAMRIAESIRQAIRDFRFTWGDHSLNIGASIGIVEISALSESPASVMSAVDVACYAAKDGGRDRVHVYQAGQAPQRHKEMHWVSKVQRAADEGRFELHFQRILAISPKARAADPGHFELVLRMRDEEGALVQPVEFIPAAERYNMMPGIDRWVVREALATLVARRGSGQKHTVSINLSGTTLNDDRFLEFLIGELAQTDLEPGALCFEITETAAISSLSNVVYFMRELKARGVTFALDDFGSGLSSFSYLKTLPVDVLKIDGQFVENVVHDAVDRSMVSAICQVARTMGLQTCAERVESREALAVLTELGVDLAQGYFIGAPQPVTEFAAALAAAAQSGATAGSR